MVGRVFTAGFTVPTDFANLFPHGYLSIAKFCICDILRKRKKNVDFLNVS